MVPVRGVEVAVRQVGRGIDIVLLHGFQNDHTAWDPYIERIDLDSYRVTALDLVGCGASASVADWQRCTIAEYAEDVVAVCAALELAAPVLIGHSLGGATALEAALTHEDRLRALVLVAPVSTTGFDFLPDAAAFESLAHPTRDQQIQLARAAFRRPPSEDEFDALITVIERATPEHIEGAARSMRDFLPTQRPQPPPAPVPSPLRRPRPPRTAAQPPRHAAGDPPLRAAGVPRRRPRALRRGARPVRRRRRILPGFSPLTVVEDRDRGCRLHHMCSSAFDQCVLGTSSERLAAFSNARIARLAPASAARSLRSRRNIPRRGPSATASP